MTIEQARKLDSEDPLRIYRQRFEPTEPGLIYLDGNSLGRPLTTSKLAVNAMLSQWAKQLVRGWGEGWYDLSERLGAKIGKLIGAQPGEVIVCDSTSVNLFKLVLAALARDKRRLKIVTDDLNFPSDHYVLQGCAKLLDGAKVHTVRSHDGISVDPAVIEAALDSDTALLTLSLTSFKSGFVHDAGRLTKAAHDAGALVLWDLSHSVGVQRIDLNEWEADVAVGCTYKYLNGGPGSPAFLYVRRDLQSDLHSPISGWFGHSDPFEFGLDYRPADGMRRFLSGTPPLLSMVPMEAALDLIEEAGLDAIRSKSERLTEALIELYDDDLAPLGVELRSPRDVGHRGSHVTFGHPEAFRIDQALIREHRVIPDFRAPDCVRFGVAPLSNGFEECFQAVHRMRQVINEKSFERYSSIRSAVT